MAIIDIGLLALLSWGGVHGFRRGFLTEFFSMTSFVAAGLVSNKLLDPITAICLRWSADWGKVLPYIASIFIFMAAVIIINALGKLFVHFIKPTLLGHLDQLLGCILGVMKWGLLVSTCLWCSKHLFHTGVPAQYTEHAVIFPVVESLAPRCFALWLNSWHMVQAWFFPHTARHSSPQ